MMITMMLMMIMVMVMVMVMKPLGPSLVWNCLPSHGMHHGRRREGRETSAERTPMDGSSSRGVPGRPADRRSRSPAGRAVQPRGPPPPRPVRANLGPPTWTEPDSPVPSSVYAESGEEESVDSQGSSFSMVLEGDDLEQAKAFVSSLYRNMQLELFPTDSTRRLAGGRRPGTSQSLRLQPLQEHAAGAVPHGLDTSTGRKDGLVSDAHRRHGLASLH
eukprot:s10646_g2.t1